MGLNQNRKDRMSMTGNFFAESIIKKYKKTGEYAYQGISLVFLETDKEKEDAPVKSEVSILYHLLLQEIYYRYHNQMVINRNEILTGIERAIEQHFDLAKKKEPQGFREVYSLYQEMKNITKEENLQRIEKQIRERIGITIEKIDGVSENVERIQPMIEIGQDSGEIQTQVVHKFGIQETNSREIEKRQQDMLSNQIQMVSENQIAQVVLPMQSKISALYGIQEKFFYQIERAKEITNLTGQEYELQQQVLLSLVQTATEEEQQTLYQYFDQNHFVYIDTNQINKNQSNKEVIQTYETAELLQIVRDMDTEYIRVLAEKWKKEIETKKENSTDNVLNIESITGKTEGINEISYVVTEKQKEIEKEKREVKDKREVTVKKEVIVKREEDRIDKALETENRIRKKEMTEKEAYFISESQGERTEHILMEHSDIVEQSLLYLEWKLREIFGKENYETIKQEYLKSLSLVLEYETEDRRERERIEDRKEVFIEEKKQERNLEQEKVWQITQNMGIDSEKEIEKAVLFSIISTKSRLELSESLSEDFFLKNRLEETIRNMNENQIRNLVEKWKTETDIIQNIKEKSEKGKIEEKKIRDGESEDGQAGLLKQPLTEIQRIKRNLLNVVEEGKSEDIVFLYEYLTERNLIHRYLPEKEEVRGNQEIRDRQEKIIQIEEQRQIDRIYKAERTDFEKDNIERAEEEKSLIQKRREIEDFLNHLKEDTEEELLVLWQENRKRLSFYTDKNKAEIEERRKKSDSIVERKEIRKEIFHGLEQKVQSIEKTNHLFLNTEKIREIKEYLLTSVETGESEVIDSLYEYLTERKLIYRKQADREEKQKEVKHYLKEFQQGENFREELLMSYWNVHLNAIYSRKVQKEKERLEQIEEERTRLEREQEEVQKKSEEIQLERTRLESEQIEEERERLERRQEEWEEAQKEKMRSEKVPPENIQREIEIAQEQVQQREKESNFASVSRDIRIYKEREQRFTVQEKMPYVLILERYQQELQRLGMNGEDGEQNQQRKRMGIFLRILEESSLEESNSLYQYMEQNHLLYYEKNKVYEKNKISEQAKIEKAEAEIEIRKTEREQTLKEGKEIEESLKKEILTEWIRSATEETFYKLQEKFIEEYEKQQMSFLGQVSLENLEQRKGSHIASMITKYFESLQTILVQKEKGSILERQKQLLVKTILEGSKEEEQNLYDYLAENHFIYRKEENKQQAESEEERISLEKKRILTEQIKQFDTKELNKLLEQVLVYQKEQREITEGKEESSFLKNKTIIEQNKLIYSGRNIRIAGEKNILIEHKLSESGRKYLAKENISILANKKVIENRTEGNMTSYLLPYQEVSLLFKKEQNPPEEAKEQVKKVKEVIQHDITKTTKAVEKQINWEAENTKKEMEKQQKELLFIKTELKQQQEKIEEMERNQLKEINSEKIYQTVMKKMEAQLRLERLKRGLS